MKELFELIRRLRTENPSTQCASTAARWFGIVCLGVVFWNLLVVSTMTPGTFLFKIDTFETKIALSLIAFAGLVALVAASRLKTDPVSGARVAKLSLLLWMAGLVVFLAGFWINPAGSPPGVIGLVFRIFMIPVFGQFLVPGWFALGYLNRLEEAQTGVIFAPDPTPPLASFGAHQKLSCREGLFPWGAAVTFLLSMAFVMGGILLVEFFMGNQCIPYVAVPGFLLLFVGPIAWNERASSFQGSREIVSTCRAGISMLFFHATFPFCKVLVYRDGLELRIEFTRYFLPYDKCIELLKLEGMLGNTLVLRTRIPGVPETIRIQTRQASTILAEIEAARAG